MKKNTAKLVTIGYGGNTMHYGRHHTGSWYLFTPEDIAHHYAHELAEGVLLLDKRPAIDINAGYAVASPLVNVDLDPGTIDRLQLTDFARSVMIPALKQSGHATALTAHEISREVAPQKAGPLDHVDTLAYVAWWLDRGATLYRYDGEAFQPATEMIAA